MLCIVVTCCLCVGGGCLVIMLLLCFELFCWLFGLLCGGLLCSMKGVVVWF